MAIGFAATMLLLPVTAIGQDKALGKKSQRGNLKPFAGVKISRNTALPFTMFTNAKSNREATVKGKSYAPAHSQAIVPPYRESFDTETSMTAFTIIDNNNDGSTWSYDAEIGNGCAKYGYSEDYQGDDWLITPPIRMEQGKRYTIKFKLKTKSSFYSEKIEVKFGNAATVEAMTQELLPETPVKWEEFEEITREVTPTETGDYYFGFHAISDRDQYAFFLDDIEVSAGATLLMPDMVSDLQVTPGAQGSKTATITFNMPTKSINGTPITEKISAKVYRNDEIIKELSNLEPGSSQTVVDENSTE